LRFPTREDIVRLNRRLVEETGGEFVPPDNLMNPGSLEWVLEAIQYPLFGVDQYPTLADKAALLAWIIIEGHVFHDGNKRTGMATLISFIRLNGYQLDVSPDEIVEVALRVGWLFSRNF
jgi:death-on-curing protein